MAKLITFLVLVAAAIGGALYITSKDDRGPIGAPVLSETPAEATETPAAFADGIYRLDAAASRMEWSGTKTLIVNYVDRGTVSIASGSAAVVDGVVASGSVVVDLATITPTVTGRGSGESTLQKHLKSADFFDIAKYPTATFVFEKLVPASLSGQFTVSGSLTIKGVTKPIEFPAVLTGEEDRLTMEATATLDRTQWGLTYASGNFFKNLGDKVIGDMFTVHFVAVGTRQ
ncbi:MAG: YceI family protein [Candidatus Yanofskybacteria bacterium]|nr:YceI family protein [Candidatus Yanofskybacteria bacterium]